MECEKATDIRNLLPEIQIERQEGPYDNIVVGNTGVIFRFWKEGKDLELVFWPGEAGPPSPNPQNVTKLCLGLLGFYRWANSPEGKNIVEGCKSTAGATNSRFFETLWKLLDRNGHRELFVSFADGSANIYAGIDVSKFAALSPNDQLIGYLEKIKKRCRIR